MEIYTGGLIGLQVLCSIICLTVFKFFHKFWWVPMQFKHVMRSQGISGPSYSFIHGNTKQITTMKIKSTSLPMEISNYILPRVQPHLHTWFQLYGKKFMYWRGPQPELVVAEPEVVKEIMSDKANSTRKPVFAYSVRKIIGEGIISSEGEKWAKQRKLATHAFNGERLKNMTPLMIQSVDMMLKRWKDNGVKEMDVYGEFKMLASDVISRTAFGSSYEDGNKVFRKLEELQLLAGKTAYENYRFGEFRDVFKDKTDVESDKLQADIRDIIMQMIKKRENQIASREEESSKTDYLGLLLNAHHDFDESYKLSLQDIVDDCKSFYFAGQDTIALLLSWASFLLGVHTEWQDKARKEVQQVFGKEKPSLEGLSRLKTVSMIINETLRLYPPAFFTLREVQKEMEVGNLVLPANMHLNIQILALQQDTRFWGEDAHLFKPERFSQGIAKATNNNQGMYLPFGYGPRMCPGSNYALNEAKITLSMILQRYTFTLSPKYVHEPIHQVTLKPKFGVRLLFQPL
ncbi:cytochrome P450 CYP749A22-like [Rutidosis leptorrhynchoides]|uniref:cytochrome P450 CYP749A22-like n=1 Tax=Rutidosis leptorrhynchoides TaxID=125765 RepID=UPI003A99C028